MALGVCWVVGGGTTHWLLIGYHAGYPDPKKNGHEVMCLPRDRVSAQEAMAFMEATAAQCGPVQAGAIGIVEPRPGLKPQTPAKPKETAFPAPPGGRSGLHRARHRLNGC